MERAQGTFDKVSELASEDVISSMPDYVITNIMNRLPIRDAVRTGILARNWRLKWTLLTQIVIDNGISRSLAILGPEGKKYYDSRVISRLLLILIGPVTKFVLHIRCDQILDVGDLNHWVLFLSRKGIKEFTLVNLHDVPLKLPIDIFSCVALTHLKLGNCLFHPSPTFCGFPKVTSLDLRMVHFESGKYGELITRCPLLEIMEIVADYRHYSMYKIYLDDIAKLGNLKKLTLPLRELENRVITTSSIFQFLGCLPKLEELYLDFLWCELVVEDAARNWVPTTFPSLNTLRLMGIDFGNGSMLSCAFEMIWGSPNLQELRISVPGFTDAYEFYVPPTALFSSDSGSNTAGQLQLKRVIIESFRGSKNEICLMKYLLACSPFLKRIAIYSLPSLGSDEKLKAATDLLKLYRASPVAKVDFF